MRVQLVDPSAFTPPYDRSLAAALARAGASVELVTSRFPYGPVPAPAGYAVSECFYGLSSRLRPGTPGRLALKLAEHVPNMLALRRRTRRTDLVHYQWLSVQPLDARLLPPKRPRVLTAHDILPREPRPGQIKGTRRLLEAMDAVIVHSRAGAARLEHEAGVAPDRVHVIHHGAFDYLTHLPEERPLPPELAAVEAPVILFFGLLRPYKGLEVLLDAHRELEGAELWIVGRPRMPLDALEARARRSPGPVRFVPRFIEDRELAAYLRRADLVALPYREIDQSGVLATALAFAKPIVVSSVGGFTEIARDFGAAELTPSGDAQALAATLRALIDDPARRAELAAAAGAAAAGPLSWDRAAELTLALYRRLLDG